MMNYKEFKQTQTGKIPKDWEIVRLREVGELQYGYTCSAIKEDTGIKLLRITDINDNGKVNWKSVPYCDVNKSNYEKYKLALGDILFARIGATTGKTAFVDRKVKGVFASYLIKFKPVLKDLETKFLYYVTQSNTYWIQVHKNKEGQLKKGLNAKVLGNIELSLPPLPEQKKIAEILSTVDQAIEKVDQAIEKTQRLKTGLMQELLTKGIGHKEFKDTEIGRIPKEWEVVKLGEIIKYEKGRKPKILFDQEEKNTVPYLSAETLRTGAFIQWATENRELIKVNNDDVILIWDGYYCGDSFIGFDGLLSSTMIKIEPKNPNLNERFLFYFLKACFKELNTKISGMYLKHVNKFILESQTLPLPPLHEQHKIAEVISSVDERLELLRKRKERLEKIKKGLMNDLLGGMKRVKLS